MTTPEIIEFLGKEQARQGIKDVAICEAVKINRSTLWRIKNNLTAVTNTQIVEIAKTLGFEVILNKISK